MEQPQSGAIVRRQRIGYVDKKDRKPEFMTTVSQFEADRLGLGEEKIIFTAGHVNSLVHIMSDGKQQVSLWVNDIEVQGFDPLSQMFNYKVTGIEKYSQPWSTGGAYLHPDTVPPRKEKV